MAPVTSSFALQCRSPAAAQHASPMHGPASGPGQGPLPAAPGPHPHGPAPGMHANGPGPGPAQNGPGPGPLLQPPPAAPRGPPQPLTQFPVELGNFINKLPPARTLEGAHPNIDQVSTALHLFFVLCVTQQMPHFPTRHNIADCVLKGMSCLMCQLPIQSAVERYVLMT